MRPAHAGRNRRLANKSVRITLVAGFVVVALLALDAAWSSFQLYRGLEDAEALLVRGSEQLLDGDTEGALETFAQARGAASSASTSTRHPAMLLAALAPVVGPNVRAIRSASEAMLLAADAADRLTSAAQAAGFDGRAIPGFSNKEGIDTRVIEDTIPALRSAADKLAQADKLMDDVNPADLSPLLRERIASGKSLLSQRADQAARLAGGAALLWALLGGAEPRDHLLVMMNTADPRGAGGYPGVYGIMHSDGRAIDVGRMRPVSGLPVLAKDQAVDAPVAVIRRYGPFGATTNFISTTYSPDFPTDARLMQAIWKATGHSPADIVVAADPVALSAFMRALDLSVANPVKSGRFPATLTADNIRSALERDTFLTPSQEESNRWQAAIGTAVWKRILHGPWGPRLIEAAGQAVEEGHLLVYSADTEEQMAVSRLGADGSLVVGPDQAVVTFNGYTPNRAGFYVDTDVVQTSEPTADGDRLVKVTVTMKSDAPKGPPSISLGMRDGSYAVGTYGALVDLFLPKGATDPQVEVKQTAPVAAGPGGRELGYDVISTTMQVGPGRTSVATFTYRGPE